ncbi:MAG: hypothetical protein WBX25_20115 [Rhodomicrobium sp.]
MAINNPQFHAEARAAYDTVCAIRNPIFVTGEFCFKSFGTGAHHAWSNLLLPLSDDGTAVNKIVSIFIARLCPVSATTDWLEYQPAKVLEVADFKNTEELEKLCLDWGGLTAIKVQRVHGQKQPGWTPEVIEGGLDQDQTTDPDPQ